MYKNAGDGFINCDTSFLYKLIRNYDLIPRPTQGCSEEATVIKNSGDVVEKLRELRNLVVHRPQVKFAKKEVRNMQEGMRILINEICLVAPNNDLSKHMENYIHV